MLNLFMKKRENFLCNYLNLCFKNDSATNNSDVLTTHFLKPYTFFTSPTLIKVTSREKNANFEKSCIFISKMGIF